MARKAETDLSRYDFTKAKRGRYLQKAERSFETIVVDKKVLKVLGGPDALAALLRALATSVEQGRRRRSAA